MRFAPRVAGEEDGVAVGRRTAEAFPYARADGWRTYPEGAFWRATEFLGRSGEAEGPRCEWGVGRDCSRRVVPGAGRGEWRVDGGRSRDGGGEGAAAGDEVQDSLHTRSHSAAREFLRPGTTWCERGADSSFPQSFSPTPPAPFSQAREHLLDLRNNLSQQQASSAVLRQKENAPSPAGLSRSPNTRNIYVRCPLVLFLLSVFGSLPVSSPCRVRS